MLRPGQSISAFVTATLLSGAAAAQTGPNVAVSIRPLHSLVAAVTEGVADTQLIMSQMASPHRYALRPSDAETLQNADVVFWIGPALETFLEGPLETLAADAHHVSVMDIEALSTLPVREGGEFEAHDHSHDDHDHDEHGHDEHDHDEQGHDDHAHDDHAHDDHAHDEHAHDDHDHDEHAHDDHAHDAHDHDEHAHGEHGIDAHLWLDPANAVVIVDHVAHVMAEADPANADQYRANADAAIADLEALTAELDATLEPVRGIPFIVFHDAYQYFEARFGLQAAGSVTISPEVAPGAARVQEIQERLEAASIVCVFTEPQFAPRIVDVIIEGTDVRIGMLDPIGAEQTAGPSLYGELLRSNAAALNDCLLGEG